MTFEDSGAVNLDSSSNVSVKATGNLTLEATGNLELKGANVKLKGGGRRESTAELIQLN